MPTDTSAHLDTADDVVAFTRGELDRVQRETNEVRLLVRQTQNEVEKLGQRRTQIISRLRDMEANLETYGRQEIRSTYLTVQEAEMRLFMMNSQLEQLQAKLKFLDRYAQHLQKSIDMLGQAPIPRPATATMAEVAPAEPAASGVWTPAPVLALGKVIQVQEDERQRVAKHMHEGPVQSLSNLILRAEICERLIGLDLQQAKTELSTLKHVVNNTLQETRKFIFHLRPMILDDLGLMPTLRRYANDLSRGSNVSITITAPGAEQRLPPNLEIALFRIAQETLQNAVHHAHANRINLQLEIYPPNVSLIIEDDGQGFDLQAALASAPEHSAIGLPGIYERAAMFDGDLKIETGPGQGTRVELRVANPEAMPNTSRFDARGQ